MLSRDAREVVKKIHKLKGWIRSILLNTAYTFSAFTHKPIFPLGNFELCVVRRSRQGGQQTYDEIYLVYENRDGAHAINIMNDYEIRIDSVSIIPEEKAGFITVNPRRVFIVLSGYSECNSISWEKTITKNIE